MICRTSESSRFYIIRRGGDVKSEQSYQEIQSYEFLRKARMALPEKYKCFVWT